MYCRECGKQIDEGVKFCTYCGAPQGPGPDPRPEPQQGQAVGFEPIVAPDRTVAKPQVQPQVQAQAQPQAQAPLQAVTHKQEKVKGIWIVLGVLLAFAVGLGFGVLHSCSGTPASEPTDVVAPDEGEETVDDAATTDEAATKDTEEEEGAVKVQSSLPYYSWEELATIASMIAECPSGSEALVIAQQYHLLDEGGRYPTATKSMLMDDGVSVSMRLVGVWHDEADTTSGHAGLTFLADTIGYEHQVAGGTTTPGGWEGSDLRAWLQKDLYALLPDEVSSVIKPVYKLSNNAGETTSLDSVTKTTDTLWVPSIVELAGPVSWEYFTNPEQADFYNAVFNAEGTQYAAFAQESIKSDGDNLVLALGSDWWMRSTAASTGRGRYVTSSGDPSGFGDSSESHGIVFGFCL